MHVICVHEGIFLKESHLSCSDVPTRQSGMPGQSSNFRIQVVWPLHLYLTYPRILVFLLASISLSLSLLQALPKLSHPTLKWFHNCASHMVVPPGEQQSGKTILPDYGMFHGNNLAPFSKGLHFYLLNSVTNLRSYWSNSSTIAYVVQELLTAFHTNPQQ